MLQPNFKYIAFDFETTGLDRVKDEPIQIGVVIFDHEFSIIDTYSSLIKPKKQIKELRSIVTHLTGFDLKQLEDAPSMEEIIGDLEKLFEGDVVIVGHNIGFDLAFLQRYISFEPVAQIDTYVLSKALYHYVPSYALEILNEHLRKTDQHREGAEDAYHDALHDSHLGFNLFHQCIAKLTKLRREYLILDYLFQNSDAPLSRIIKRTHKPYKFEEKELFFPALQTKTHQDNKKIISDTPLSFDGYEDATHLDISLTDMKEIVQMTDRGEGQRVLAFTHPSKVQLVEALFKKQHIPVSGGHDAIVFDPDRVNTFLHKSSFDMGELLFSLKYYSQFSQKHKLLDINSSDDYKIFAALSNSEKKKGSKITVCTHQQLFEKKDSFTQDHTVLLFDKDRWYQSYTKYTKQHFDPMHLINQLEQIQYKYDLLQHPCLAKIKAFTEKTLFLHSTLSMEINPLFKGTSSPKIELNDIAHETRFPKTVAVIPVRHALYLDLENDLMDEDKVLSKKIETFLKYLEGETTISKRMYSGDRRYYQFQDTHRYVDRNDFVQALPETKKLFLSNAKRTQHDTRTSHTPALDRVESLEFLTIKTITDPSKLLQAIQDNGQSCFVVSSDKGKSKVFFDACVKQGISTTFEVLGENITGGVGKNLYRASITNKPVILIGGYNYYLGALAKGIPFDTAYLYHLHGKLAPVIVNDLMRRREK